MPNISNYIPEERIFALFTGRSGDGKSVAGASFPRELEIIDFDFRINGVAAAVQQGIISGEGLSYTQFRPREGWKKVDQYLMGLEAARVSNRFPYKTVQVDSLSALTRLVCLASHEDQSGKKIGTLRVSGPGDFNFEASGTHQFFDFLRIFPSHVIATAHVIDKYGKLDKSKEYSETGVIGEKLSIRDNLGETVLTYFTDIYRFSRKVEDGKLKFYVEFATDLARNSFGLAPGKHDITGKNFFNYLQEKIKEAKKA